LERWHPQSISNVLCRLCPQLAAGCVVMKEIVYILRMMSPAGGGAGGGFYMGVILISYMTKAPAPPPSLRDTSASGGHVMAIFAIATQSPGGGVGYRHVLL